MDEPMHAAGAAHTGAVEHRRTAQERSATVSASLVAGTIASSKLADRNRLAPSLESFGYDFGGPLVVGFADISAGGPRPQRGTVAPAVTVPRWPCHAGARFSAGECISLERRHTEDGVSGG